MRQRKIAPVTTPSPMVWLTAMAQVPALRAARAPTPVSKWRCSTASYWPTAQNAPAVSASAAAHAAGGTCPMAAQVAETSTSAKRWAKRKTNSAEMASIPIRRSIGRSIGRREGRNLGKPCRMMRGDLAPAARATGPISGGGGPNTSPKSASAASARMAARCPCPNPNPIATPADLHRHVSRAKQTAR